MHDPYQSTEGHRDGNSEEIYFYTAFRNTIFDVMRDLGWKLTNDKAKAHLIWIPKREIKKGDTFYEHQKLNHYRRAEEVRLACLHYLLKLMTETAPLSSSHRSLYSATI
jgi:hypothetical protein